MSLFWLKFRLKRCAVIGCWHKATHEFMIGIGDEHVKVCGDHYKLLCEGAYKPVIKDKEKSE